MKVICHAKEIVKKQGKTITWLSEETGIGRNHLYDILSNRRNNVYLEYAYKISHALGLTIEEVFEFVEEE